MKKQGKSLRLILIVRALYVNKYVGFLRDINQFELIDGVADAIKKINASGYLAIVVTNQPVIARGEVTVPELDEIHKKIWRRSLVLLGHILMFVLLSSPSS